MQEFLFNFAFFVSYYTLRQAFAIYFPHFVISK